MRPQATVDSVITEALQRLSRQARAQVEEALEWAGEADSVMDMRPIFAQRLRGKKGNDALVVFATGLAIFRKVDGNTRKAILGAVNFGGDCDCIGYVAAGLAGALRGIESVPEQWVETIEHELKDDPYTVSRRSLLDTARGLHQALLNELEKTKERISQLKSVLSR
jgi:ADP-ribosylglycohydrolase